MDLILVFTLGRLLLSFEPAVCRWIGNSPAVAAKHYATSIDLNADFQPAAGFATEAQQESAAVTGGTGVSSPGNRCRLQGIGKTGPSRTRTCDQRIMSPPL